MKRNLKHVKDRAANLTDTKSPRLPHLTLRVRSNQRHDTLGSAVALDDI